MNLAQRIQARTDNGDTIIDFLVEVMNGECPDFKICHRLAAARLLTNYGCGCRAPDVIQHDGAIDFIADNPTEPSRRSPELRLLPTSRYFDKVTRKEDPASPPTTAPQSAAS